MNVSLPAEVEAMIDERVSSGRYASASAVIEEALQLLRARDELLMAQREELIAAIQVGLDHLERGEIVAADVVFDGLRARSRARGQSSP